MAQLSLKPLALTNAPCVIRTHDLLLSKQSVSAAQIIVSTGISAVHSAGRAHIRAHGGR